MTHQSIASVSELDSGYIKLFNAMSSSNMLLQANPPHYTILAVTAQHLKATGLQKVEVVGKELFVVFPANTIDKNDTGASDLQASLAHVLKYKKLHQLPVQRYDVANEDGTFTEKYWSTSNNPVFNDVGEIVYILHTADDITDKVKAGKTEEAHQELQFVTDTMPQLVWATKADGYVYFFNKGWLEYTGLTLEAVKGDGWTQSLHPDDLDRTQEAWKNAYKNGARYEIEYRLKRYDGEYRWFLTRGTPKKDEHGNIVRWYGTTTDVHEQNEAEEALRESEERFRFMVNTVPQSIWITDAEGRVEFLNQHWCDYCGVSYSPTTSDEISVRFLHPEDGSMVREAFGAAMQSGESWEVEQRNLSKDGEYRWFLNRATPYKDPVTGKVLKWFGVGIDIHERKLEQEALQRSEEELEKMVAERTTELAKANEELRRSNQNLEEFAYAASHDLKEPIRKIHFFSDRLRVSLESKLEEDDRRYFERMEVGTRRMASLIDDLLLYSHVSRGITPTEIVDLNQTLTFVLDDLELHIEEKNAKIDIGPLPTIMGQQRQLQQLFENLIGNALKYGKEGTPPHVSISTKLVAGNETPLHLNADEGSKQYHLITVRDNGIGFNQEDAERIFNVFTRLHGNTEYRGTGVGLSIARKVIENHNGYVWAESEPGKGAIFNLLLPAI